MTFKIQVLALDRHNNVMGVKSVHEIPTMHAIMVTKALFNNIINKETSE
jgi:hypothetical protein